MLPLIFWQSVNIVSTKGQGGVDYVPQYFNLPPPPLCVEMGFTRTFPGNQDVTVKLKSELISIKF